MHAKRRFDFDIDCAQANGKQLWWAYLEALFLTILADWFLATGRTKLEVLSRGVRRQLPNCRLSMGAVGQIALPGCGGVWGPFVGAKRGQAVTGYACLEIQAAHSWVGHLMLFFPNRISAARLLTTPCRWALEDPFRPTTVAPRDCLSPSPSEPPPSTTHPSGLDSPGLGWSIHPLFSNCLSLSFP